MARMWSVMEGRVKGTQKRAGKATLHLHGASAAAGRTSTPAEGLWDRNDTRLAQDYKGAQRRTVPPLSVLLVYGRETQWKERRILHGHVMWMPR